MEKGSLEQQKDVTLRKKVIDEILDTEKSFNRDLNLCVDHFMKQLIEWKVCCCSFDGDGSVVMMVVLVKVWWCGDNFSD